MKYLNLNKFQKTVTRLRLQTWIFFNIAAEFDSYEIYLEKEIKEIDEQVRHFLQ